MLSCLDTAINAPGTIFVIFLRLMKPFSGDRGNLKRVLADLKKRGFVATADPDLNFLVSKDGGIHRTA